MLKTIEISGKKVDFKVTGATPLLYKAHFNSDFFSDLISLEASETGGFDTIYKFLWIMAKQANKEIPEMVEWLDEFDSFPVSDLLPELLDLLTSNLQQDTKKK